MTPSIPVFALDMNGDPQQFYRPPLEERIYRATASDGGATWVVSRYEDVNAAFRDARFVQRYTGTLTAEERAALPAMPDFIQVLESDMLSSDPPTHTRLRSLVHKAFTPRLVEALRPRIEEIAAERLDAIAARPERRIELIEDYALPLPVTVIAELLGLPPEDRNRFRAWSEVLTANDSYTEAGMETLAATAYEFMAYFSEQFSLRRAAPRADLISGLVKAEEAGDTLNETELHAMVMLILIAGHETTVNLITNGLLALLRHPDQLARLRAQPELLPAAVEECLRYAGPVHLGERYAREDFEFAGAPLQRGDRVVMMMAAANRDPARFHDPDQFNVARGENKHLSFGQGIHFCIGAPLARLETQVALMALLARFPDLRLTDEAVEWRPGSFIAGLKRLHLAF